MPIPELIPERRKDIEEACFYRGPNYDYSTSCKCFDHVAQRELLMEIDRLNLELAEAKKCRHNFTAECEDEEKGELVTGCMFCGEELKRRPKPKYEFEDDDFEGH